jgi:hypothetical protein
MWRRHRKTIAIVIAAIAATGQARSFAIATTMSTWLGTRLDSAINRLYRLLGNQRIDYLAFARQWAAILCRSADRHLLVAVDWTEWHSDLRMLVAAVVAGKRAIPLLTQAFTKAVRVRSQNSRENTFLRLLAQVLREAGLTATLLCDRGFRRASWLALLQQLELGFVVRLMDDVSVELGDERMSLRDVLLCPGRILDMGPVRLRSDNAVTVRVIGYWAPDAKEPWWLATSSDGSPRHILRLYDRRMSVEEHFRDWKGRRFGVKLIWTQFKDPDALTRFVTLLAVALLIWFVTGVSAALRKPSLRLRSRKKGPRQSFVTIGLRLHGLDPGGRHLTQRLIRTLLGAPALREIAGAVVGGK